jgi:hypothetical protein
MATMEPKKNEDLGKQFHVVCHSSVVPTLFTGQEIILKEMEMNQTQEHK